MKSAVIVFPGSNCDHDMYHALLDMGHDVRFLWHKDIDLSDADLVVLPGGFSYGDYLRAGAIAQFSPIMAAVAEFAEKGGRVMGICNGFQVLIEAGLLPGALLRNQNLRFVCRHVLLRVENPNTMFTRAVDDRHLLRIPIAHGEGRYFIDPDELKILEANSQVVFRYVDEDNQSTAAANPNGSTANIAGIINRQGNVLGMMPHPERAMTELLGSADGRQIFASLVAEAKEHLLA